MCGQISSHLMNSESTQLGYCQSVVENDHLLKNSETIDELLRIVRNNSKTVFEISGGEPLIDKSFYKFLDLLIINCLNHKVIIQVSTNGSKTKLGRFNLIDYID